MRRTFLLLVKAVISSGLLYFSLRFVNLDALTERLQRLEPGWIAAALFLMSVQLVLLSLRWRQIVICCGADLGFGAALQFNFIAGFFNQVLPSTVGGDGVRLWLLACRGAGWAKATYSVLLDRLVGVLVLALVVIACLPWTLELVRDPIARMVLLALAFGAIAAPSVLLLAGLRFKAQLARMALTRHWSAVAEVAARLCRSHRLAAIVLGCSIAIHLLTIAAAWCCIRAIAAPVSFAHVLFLMPPVLLIATVPISIAGWGVRESAMIAAFAYAGLAESDGLMLSVLFGAVGFVIGVLGGLVWIASGFRTKALVHDMAESKTATGRP